jgi:hypothetical protein
LGSSQALAVIVNSLCGADQAVARLADYDVDPVERGPGAVDDAANRRDLGQVEFGEGSLAATLCFPTSRSSLITV